MDGLDDVGLNVLLLLESEGRSVDELPLSVLGDSRRGGAGLGAALLHLGGELSDSSGQVCQHVMI